MMSFSQAAENNKTPIGEVLISEFAACRRILEIASGTGQHAVHMGALLPGVQWQTSDLKENHGKIRARLEAESSTNVLMPVLLDVAQEQWPVADVDGVFAANAVHIMSWDHVKAMFAGLDKVMAPNGVLALYGPYKYNGDFTTQSNAKFDLQLKSRDAVSGIRDFEKVDALANAIGLSLVKDHPMPANNQLLTWRRK